MEIPRNAYSKLAGEMDDKAVSIIAGPRQVGKTFLLKKLMKEATAGKKTTYYNLELPGDLRLFNGTDEQVYDRLTASGEAVFIDEFHYIKNASRIFKAVYDSSHAVKIYASGSSAMEIHKHLKESLAGRRWLTRLQPLSYAEFLHKYGGKHSPAAFSEYVAYGGSPGLLKLAGLDKKIALLNEIHAAYIQKDVRSLIKEENVRALNALVYLLAENQGSIISENGLSREVGLTAATVGKYLSLLEKTYVCHTVFSYAKKLGNELKKSKKVYLYDLGIRNAVLKDFSPYSGRQDKGAVAETFVLLQLMAAIKPNMELRFWRNKRGDEIDFVLLKDRRPFIIEVKSSLKSPEIPRAFPLFLRNYPETAGCMVISGKFTAKTSLMGKDMIFTTFQNFLPQLLESTCSGEMK
ncbi:MAG: hypothetical protein FD154_2374 [Elusimicrobia bacterium]|nr:MAG: hypothetical protein FD154_2374 [Elusimicrobiota bacterium]